MSVLGKKWVVKNESISKNTIEKILENRGLKTLEIEEFFHDPFLFKDMESSVKRIFEAIKKHERIIVFGDYDVDGITGTAILARILKDIGATVSYRLPNRVEDGYGLSEKFIREFIEKDIKLLITVDCGISCEKEVNLAKENGIDVIITDHHTIPEKGAPKKAFAILHPRDKNSNYPFKELTGAGVALKLAHALIKEKYGEEDEEILSPFVDLASLGTVADIGPIKGENWLIVKKGLSDLNNTKWIGLKKIMQLASLDENSNIDSQTIGFKLAPRINAAGRIGDPYLALSLLLQEEETEKTHLIGNKIEELNTERKALTLKALEEAEGELDKETLPDILIYSSKDWHVGILGLIAGRLAEKYARPSIIMQDFGDTLVASARSPEYFNIIEAIGWHGDLLITFGGHAQAAGFNIKKENLKEFTEKLSIYAKEKLKNVELKATLKIDCKIKGEEIDMNLFENLDKLKPFGVENERPVFLLEEIEPLFIEAVGKEKNHLKFVAKSKNKTMPVIAFQLGKYADKLRGHKKIDLAFQIDKNVWNNKETLQLQALDFRESKS
jgi:single-stranded-DNA-specific exonuclease